jgi:hypothetical protein
MRLLTKSKFLKLADNFTDRDPNRPMSEWYVKSFRGDRLVDYLISKGYTKRQVSISFRDCMELKAFDLDALQMFTVNRVGRKIIRKARTNAVLASILILSVTAILYVQFF